MIEAALTTVIVGSGFVAMLTLISAGTISNVRGNERTTAMNLARNIRELAAQKTFVDVAALNGKNYSTAVDSRELPLNDLPGWSQLVTVQPVDVNRLTTDSAGVGAVAARVTVSVVHNQKKVMDVSWYAFDCTP